MIIDDKRFCMPGFKIKSTCPKCREEVTTDLSQYYLSYPRANQPIKYICWHECADGKDSEWPVMLQVNVDLVAIEGCSIEKKEEK